MRKLVVILDPAHGADVAGKCSPDGRHFEYKWSRERIAHLKALLINEGFEVYETTLSVNEPGLTRRKNFANNIRRGSLKLLLSLQAFHNQTVSEGYAPFFARRHQRPEGYGCGSL